MGLPRPNFTQVPNVFIDDWMSKISPSATKVFIAIARKTVGYSKEVDFISISQIVNLTGLSNRVVIRATKELEDFALVVKEHTRLANKYYLNYEGMTKSHNQSDEKSQGRVTKSHNQSDEKSHTKETHIKKLNKINSYKESGQNAGHLFLLTTEEEHLLKDYGDYVRLTEKQYTNLTTEYGLNVIESYIERINQWVRSPKGREYKDYYRAITNWLKKDNVEPVTKEAEFKRVPVKTIFDDEAV